MKTTQNNEIVIRGPVIKCFRNVLGWSCKTCGELFYRCSNSFHYYENNDSCLPDDIEFRMWPLAVKFRELVEGPPLPYITHQKHGGTLAEYQMYCAALGVQALYELADRGSYKDMS